jgi:hypothetical protein
MTNDEAVTNKHIRVTLFSDGKTSTFVVLREAFMFGSLSRRIRQGESLNKHPSPVLRENLPPPGDGPDQHTEITVSENATDHLGMELLLLGFEDLA